MATAPRTVRTAVVAALKAAREDGRLRPWHEPGAAVALKVAAALSRKDVPVADLTRLSGELRKLLDELPLAPVTTSKGAGDDDGSAVAAGGAGQADSRPVGLAPVMGTGPEVGDTALPA